MLKCARADKNGEYIGPFEEYCKEHEIKLENIILKTPQMYALA